MEKTVDETSSRWVATNTCFTLVFQLLLQLQDYQFVYKLAFFPPQDMFVIKNTIGVI